MKTVELSAYETRLLAELEKLVAEVKKILPHFPGWRLEPILDDEGKPYNPNVILTEAANEEHSLSFGHDRQGRWVITTRHGRWLSHYAHSHPSIGCSPSAKPERIAAEIKRRLLPEAQKAWALAEERRHSYALSCDEAWETYQVLKPFGAKLSENGSEGSINLYRTFSFNHAISGYVRFCERHVQLELRGLDAKLACEILTLVKKKGK